MRKFLFLNQNGSQKNLPEGILRSLLRSSSFKIILSLSSLSLLFGLSAPLKLVRADSLVVQNDGEIILVIGDDVLGTFIADNKAVTTPLAQTTPPILPKSQPQKPAENKPIIPPTAKTVPLTSPNSANIIQASPSTTSTNKVRVTISTPPPVSSTNTSTPTIPRPSGSTAPITKSSPLPSFTTASSAPNQPIKVTNNLVNSFNKDVDKVIVEGQTNQAVLVIKSTQKDQITLQQGTTVINTPLSVQINTQNHSVQVVSQTGTTNLNVLPQEAVKGVLGQGIITTVNQDQAKNSSVALTQERGDVVYNIQGERSGRLLGIFPVKSSVEVKLSAQTGRVINVNQSPTFNLFGFLIR